MAQAMQTAWPYPYLFAHRGGGRLAPENTLAGMATAVQYGYGAVEFDVKLSADGICVLLHDDTLERTSNGQGLAAQHDIAALSRLDAGSWFAPRFAGEPLPTFASIATYCRAHRLLANVEIKPCPGREQETGREVARQAAALWQGHPAAPLLSSFAWEALLATRDVAPQLPRGWLIEEQWPADWAERLAELQAVSLHSDHLLLTAERVAAVRAAGYRVLAYTVNDPARATELRQWGVDGIFTDALDTIRP
ncbi:glycerophosphodiester phosphodiesterase [Vogesella oryzae]|uniref:glycerophosphodiester phosphodiesterase n=1 Tax=Vogesella oryzae TaxID=1735285 RepID=UPI001FE68788|nr:glycerophosphodiester phosphodiesterase [Vogesella oryzae]